jgi:hypothetical protein
MLRDNYLQYIQCVLSHVQVTMQGPMLRAGFNEPPVQYTPAISAMKSARPMPTGAMNVALRESQLALLATCIKRRTKCSLVLLLRQHQNRKYQLGGQKRFYEKPPCNRGFLAQCRPHIRPGGEQASNQSRCRNGTYDLCEKEEHRSYEANSAREKQCERDLSKQISLLGKT